MNHTRRGQGPHDAYRSYSQPDTMPVNTGPTAPNIARLTWREQQVFDLHDGPEKLSFHQIHLRLGISEKYATEAYVFAMDKLQEAKAK